jgi:hypothetical protein
VLTEAQVTALGKAKAEKETHGEFDSECPGYCGAQDTFYVGTLKGVGRVYQQTFIDTYAKVAFGKHYDRKTPITAEAATVLLQRHSRASTLKTWGLALAKLIGMRRAKVAVARKLAVIMHRLWSGRSEDCWGDLPVAA